MSHALTPTMTLNRDQLTSQKQLHTDHNQDIDHLLNALQNQNPVARRTAMHQLVNSVAPTEEKIRKVQSVAEAIDDPEIKATLEEGITAMTQAAESVWVSELTADALRYPNRCTCCGSASPLEKKRIIVSSKRQKFRMRFELPHVIGLNLPSCTKCKQRLNRSSQIHWLVLGGLGLALSWLFYSTFAGVALLFMLSIGWYIANKKLEERSGYPHSS